MILCEQDAAPLIDLCVFEDNYATRGGAISCLEGSSPVIQFNQFIRNHASDTGGAVYVYEAAPVIGGVGGAGNYFQDNWAGAGADLRYEGTPGTPVNAKYNTFAGHLNSTYAVAPKTAFDLAECYATGDPITQDIYVSTTGSDEEDGLSWATAFQTLQHALSRAAGTPAEPITIHLAEGTYSTPLTGERFPLPLVSHAFIQGAGKDQTIMDTEALDGGLYGREITHVEISDITVTKALPNGGLTLIDTTATAVRQCRFDTCVAYLHGDGGGIYLRNASPVIEDCDVIGNIALGNGGGMVCDNGSPVISGCQFSYNSAYNENGGGICIINQSAPVIEDSDFNGNHSHAGRGGAIYSDQSSLVVRRCSVTGNYAPIGGGIACFASDASVLGGEPGDGNTFSGNTSGAGADLFCDAIPDPPIDAWNGSFQGSVTSDYYVSPPEAFDVSGHQSQLQLIEQDVYVAPDGDDANDGLTPDTAFRTIHHAMSRIYGTSGNPRTVHLAPGRYARSVTGEVFPLPMIRHVSLSGNNDVEVDLESPLGMEPYACGGMVGRHDTDVTIAGLKITGAAILGAVRLFDCNDIVIADCRFMQNYTKGALTGGYGGGITCTRSSPRIENCLFWKNNVLSGNGGAVACLESSPSVAHCTLYQNLAQNDGGGIYTVDTGSSPTCIYSILWGNSPADAMGPGKVDVTWSDTETTLPGTGNIHADPEFVTGPLGEYYLAQIAAGQGFNSPCVDAGNASADTICYETDLGSICMHTLTTRNDEIPDWETVDLGYHYPTDESPVTPTPFPSATPSPVPSQSPTSTPTSTPTPGCSDLGVTLWMPAHVFQPGMTCRCTATVCNPGITPIVGYPLWVILDVYGALYYAPGFTMEPDNYLELSPVFLNGETEIDVLPAFTWPDTGTSASGIWWYAAMTNREMTDLYGDWDSYEFGWK